jgi:hypothetical protein
MEIVDVDNDNKMMMMMMMIQFVLERLELMQKIIIIKQSIAKFKVVISFV